MSKRFTLFSDHQPSSFQRALMADEKQEEAKAALEGTEGGEPSTPAEAPAAEAAAEAVPKGPEIKLTVKHGQQNHQLSMPQESSVKELMDVLQGLTNVHPRGQKLIFKGEACAFSRLRHVLDVGIWCRPAGSSMHSIGSCRQMRLDACAGSVGTCAPTSQSHQSFLGPLLPPKITLPAL